MNQLTVVAPAFFPDTNPCHLLIESCRRFDLNLHLYGVGKPWPWLFDAKVTQLIREIEVVDSKYVLVSDADDAFFLTGEEEIMSKYHEFNFPILVSADRQQEEGDSKFPQSIFRDLYPPSPTPWRYCNSGGYLGEKQDILRLLDSMSNVKQPEYLPVWRSRDFNNDQFCMSLVYLNGFPLKVDRECRVFQTMGYSNSEEFEYRDGRMYNTITKSFPCATHFNGNAPGIKEAYEKCFEQVTIQ